MTCISIIIPAFNERATIVSVLERVRNQQVDGFTFEIVVIDDGSTDGTHEILSDRPELYDHLVKMPVNGGKGAAVQAGLQHASGDYILFQDADLEYDPHEYPALLYPVRAFDADVVMGSRFIAPRYTRVHYFWNKVGNKFITLLFNIFNNTTFTDIYSCYLLYRRKLLDPAELKTRGWEQHAEILSIVARHADVIYDVPISYHGRSYEEGKKIRAHHVISVIKTIIAKRLFG